MRWQASWLLALAACVAPAAGGKLEAEQAYISALQNPSGTTELVLNTAELTGTLPTGLGSIVGLTKLSLKDNALSGPIPTELGNLKSLVHLVLGQNSLGGSLPSQLGALVSLTSLHLGSNQLAGKIPSEMGGLVNLQHLSLAYNGQEGKASGLTGSVPSELLGGMGSLLSLELQANSLTGTIPIEIAQTTSLTQLVLSMNEFSGALPQELLQLTNLKQLYLEMNLLTGSVPSELGALPLTDCDLTVPESLVGADRAGHPFNTFLPPIPPEVLAVCTCQATNPWHYPSAASMDCTMCLRHRCTLWGMNKCAAHWGFKDPQRQDKTACMCVCCSEQCGVSPSKLHGQACPGEDKGATGSAPAIVYPAGMDPKGHFGQHRGVHKLAEEGQLRALGPPAASARGGGILTLLTAAGAVGVLASALGVLVRSRSGRPAAGAAEGR